MWKSHCNANDPGKPTPDRGRAPESCPRGLSAPCGLRGGTVLLLLLALLLMGGSHVSSHQVDGGGGGGGNGASGSSFTPTFQPAPCPFTVGAGLIDGRQIRCGYVTVLENHAIETGKTVKLAVAVFKATRFMHSVDPAPVLRLEGGPGGSSLASIAPAITAKNYPRIISNHDLIVFDQRGAGYSTPSLACPEITVLATNILVMNTQTVRACHDRLVSEGINLNNFNTLQNAADVSDLIHALGYQQMTLNGSSYGTRLALTVMRLYPHVVRAAVLDSVYPPNHNRDELTTAAQRAFTLLFRRCAEDANCNAKYPNLQNVFYQVVDQLNAHPINFTYTEPGTKQQVSVTSYTGANLIATMYASFYNVAAIPLLPNLIYQAKAQVYTSLAALYGASPVELISWGMFFSTECSEDWPFLTRQDINRSRQAVSPQIAQAIGAREQMEYDVCRFWKVQPVPAIQKRPVQSDLPTLVLAGEYDPITPPANGQEVAHNLSHSYSFLFPSIGHGVQYNSSCADQIMFAFEDHPNQQPDSSCLAQLSGPTFQ